MFSDPYRKINIISYTPSFVSRGLGVYFKQKMSDF